MSFQRFGQIKQNSSGVGGGAAEVMGGYPPYGNTDSDPFDYASAPKREAVCGNDIQNMLNKISYWNAGGFSSNAWANAKAEGCLRCPKTTLPSFPPARGFIYPTIDKQEQTVSGRPESLAEIMASGQSYDFSRDIQKRRESAEEAAEYEASAIGNASSYGYGSPEENILMKENPSAAGSSVYDPNDNFRGNPSNPDGEGCFDYTGTPLDNQAGFVQCLNPSNDNGALPWQTAAPSSRMWNPMPQTMFLHTNYEKIKDSRELSKNVARSILEGSVSNSSSMDAKLARYVLDGEIDKDYTLFPGCLADQIKQNGPAEVVRARGDLIGTQEYLPTNTSTQQPTAYGCCGGTSGAATMMLSRSDQPQSFGSSSGDSDCAGGYPVTYSASGATPKVMSQCAVRAPCGGVPSDASNPQTSTAWFGSIYSRNGGVPFAESESDGVGPDGDGIPEDSYADGKPPIILRNPADETVAGNFKNAVKNFLSDMSNMDQYKGKSPSDTFLHITTRDGRGCYLLTILFVILFVICIICLICWCSCSNSNK